MNSDGRVTPLVSIVVPSFNQGRYIRKTLQSILEQDYRPIEVLVVDGASTDDTLSVLREFDNCPQIVWTSEPDEGPVDAVNKGLARASGEICGVQSSDDYYLPGAIGAAVEVFRSEENVGLVYGDYIRVDENGTEQSRFETRPFSLTGLLSTRVVLVQPTVFFRRDLAVGLGGWNREYPYTPDSDLWIRIAFRSCVRRVRRFQACVRVHGTQRDRQRATILENYVRMIARSPEIASGSLRIRAAAAAGVSLMRIRYGTNLSDSQVTALSWLAVLRYPPLAFGRIPVHRLVPGYFRLTGAWSKVRRWFGGVS